MVLDAGPVERPGPRCFQVFLAAPARDEIDARAGDDRRDTLVLAPRDRFRAPRECVDDPGYFAFYILRGNAHRATGDSQSALADFDQVIALAPQSGFGYALRAELKLQMGDDAAAALDISTAMELETIDRIDGAALVTDRPAMIPMTFGRVYYLPFEAHQGDKLTLSAISVKPGAVDPVILIVAPDGTPLIYNDDADVDADVLDAVIADFEAPADGTYMLMVSHARGGSEGNIEVLVARP
jgi:hypothetical protein